MGNPPAEHGPEVSVPIAEWDPTRDEPADLQSAWTDLMGRLSARDGSPAPEPDRVAQILGDESILWPPEGWTPGLEGAAWRTLNEATSRVDPVPEEVLAKLFEDGPWTRLFLVSHQALTTRVDADHCLTLWSTRPIHHRNRPTEADNPLLRELHLLALLFRRAVVEKHSGVGYHLHLENDARRHLGYRLLFDRNRSQDELAWERHGSAKSAHMREEAYRPYGDPELSVLGAKVAKDIYTACLRACRANADLNGGLKYREWAAKFEPTSKKSYVAHPAPAIRATPWPVSLRSQ